MATSKIQKKVAIIGAGPAGLASAYKLVQAGYEVDVYEVAEEVGGMCRTLTLWGYKVDLGPHRFFSSYQRVNLLWKDLVGEEFTWVSRQTRIFYLGKFFTYPLRLVSTLVGLGLRESFLCLGSYLKQIFVRSKSEHNFEDWVVSRFGYRLYKTFFKTYSEKLWGIPCKNIDADFAYRKIRRMDFFGVLKNFFSYKKTYVEYFAYPNYGTIYPYKKMAERIQKRGGRIHLKTPVIDIKKRDQTFFIKTPINEGLYDFVVSSMPLPKLVHQLGAKSEVLEASQKLKFRNTILVYLLISGDYHFPDNWLYVHSPKVDFGRVTNFRNWSPKLYRSLPDTVLCLEYWCDENDSLWSMSEEELVSKARNDLRESKLIKSLQVQEGTVYKIPKSYPVFEVGYRTHLNKIQGYLSSIDNLYVIGRYGSFKYNNQDHSVLMGLQAADSILAAKKHDIQTINTDHIYEEDIAISEI